MGDTMCVECAAGWLLLFDVVETCACACALRWCAACSAGLGGEPLD